MIRKGLLVSALMAGAVIGATPAQASVELSAVSGIINQLHDNSSFSTSNLSFSICQNGSCQTQFTGLSGLYSYNGLSGLNSWANTGSYANSGGFFDNYRFTFTGTTQYFGNAAPQSNSEVPPAPIPEPATWALMILGFGLVGLAMRRKSVALSFG